MSNLVIWIICGCISILMALGAFRSSGEDINLGIFLLICLFGLLGGPTSLLIVFLILSATGNIKWPVIVKGKKSGKHVPRS